MQNRLEKISNTYTNYSLPSSLGLFEGPQDIDELIKEHIKYEKAKEEGKKEIIEVIALKIRKQINDYILLITKITDFVNDTVKKELSEVDFKIENIKTNFYLSTRRINILFIIDSDIENELKFYEILNEMEKIIFESENYIAELFSLNKRNSELDIDSLLSDYPFTRKIKE